MSVHNTLKLVRNLRRERNPMIVYENRATTWENIFKKHPLENKENENNFHQMEHCKQYLGDTVDPILVLRTGPAWDTLRKISEKSLSDCKTFYEVAKKTLLNKEGILNESIHGWFKIALTAIYLAYKDAPESLNYLRELQPEQREKSLAFSFQYFSTMPLDKYYENKDLFNINHFNDKLILWYWDVDARQHNFIDNVIEYIHKKSPMQFDYDYIADHVKPNNLFKYQSYEIQKKFFSFSELKVETKRYFSDDLKRFCLLNKKVEHTTLNEIFDLFMVQQFLKDLEKSVAQEKYPHKFMTNAPGFKQFYTSLDGNVYKSIDEVFNSTKINIDQESMFAFIEKNKKASEEDKGTPVPEYWKEVGMIFATKVLEKELPLKTTVKKKTKV